MGIQINGQTDTVTATDGSINVGGDVTIPGVLTYEDVTNVDSVGVITARSDVSIADKIVHTGDTDTAIRFPGADQVSIETGGTQRLLIGSDGKLVHSTSAAETVDFGTSNSSGSYHKYDLGSSGATVGYIGAGSQIVSGSNVADFGVRSQANLVFSSGGDTERLRITSDGKVGIGSEIPQNKLDVAGDVKILDNSPRLFFYDANASGASSATGGFEAFDKDGNKNVFVGAFAPNADNLIFGVTGSERARITSGGNLLLGRTSDYWSSRTIFQENKDGRTQVLVKNDNNHASASSCIAMNAFGNSWVLDVGSSLKNGNSLTLGVDASIATPSEKLRITTAGKVLINSTDNSNNATMVVKGLTDNTHPIIKVRGTNANGYTFLGDDYSGGDESQFTMGLAYSGASIVTGWGVKVSTSANDAYLSSQDTYSTKHSAIKHDGSGWRFLSNSTSQTVTTDSAVTLTERLRIQSDGILKLSTAGSTVDGTFFSTLTINNTGSNTFSRVRFDRSGVARFGLTLRNDDKLCISNLYEGGSVTANDNSFVMDANSNIGVGVNPVYSGVFGGAQRVLHIGGTTAPGLRIQSSTSNQGDFIIQAGNSGGATYLTNQSSNADTVFYTSPSGTAKESLRIASGGELSISGTKSSNNISDAILKFNIVNSNGDSKKAEIKANKLNDISSDLIFSTTSSHTFAERFRISQHGRVGVNDDTGGYAEALQVTSLSSYNQYCLALKIQNNSGTLVRFANGTTAPCGSITSSGGNSTSFNTSSSDSRLKKNFETWDEEVLPHFKSLQPKKFNFTSEDDGTEKTKGFVAQDNVSNFPEAYPLTDNPETNETRYMYNPSGMVIYLMKALQEEIAKREALEDQYNALADRITALEP